LALRAFRGLVNTVATSLHKDNIVHRDIKPANVFIGADGRLIPGDFGIVFLPNQEPRPTVLGERVGPWEYMPPWADGLGDGLEKVQPGFDVYMLGKLLWCMVAGRLRLRREDHREPEFDLGRSFPDNRYMQLINSILDKCLVKRPQDCLPSAQDLLKIVDENLATIEQGVPLLDEKGKLILPCRICGKGFCQDQGVEVRLQEYDAKKNMGLNLMHLRVFVCNVCTHREFFAPNYPNESAQRGWKPWTPRL
jgi:serine/threonine protein kinase